MGTARGRTQQVPVLRLGRSWGSEAACRAPAVWGVGGLRWGKHPVPARRRRGDSLTPWVLCRRSPASQPPWQGAVVTGGGSGAQHCARLPGREGGRGPGFLPFPGSRAGFTVLLSSRPLEDRTACGASRGPGKPPPEITAPPPWCPAQKALVAQSVSILATGPQEV